MRAWMLGGMMAVLLGGSAMVAADDEFRLREESAGDGVVALVGPLGDRSYDNHGLNATFGVIDTPEGAILVDSGASRMGAELLEDEARRLTGKPVRWVINTGAQDHRWLGNGYFIERGADVIAHARTVRTQQAELHNQLVRLEAALGDRLDGTDPAQANRVVGTDRVELELGGRRLELHYLADAHFPGDVVLWLPEERVLFAGDHVYVERLLSIRAFSNAEHWLAAFGRLAAFAPERIVPGHGGVTDMAGAQRDTGDYLRFVVEGVRRFAEDMAGVEAAVAELGEAPQFAHLANYVDLHRANLHQVYLQLEAGF